MERARRQRVGSGWARWVRETTAPESMAPEVKERRARAQRAERLEPERPAGSECPPERR